MRMERKITLLSSVRSVEEEMIAEEATHKVTKYEKVSKSLTKVYL